MASNVCSHVKVVVRVRPTNDREKRENCRNVVQVVDNHMLIFDPKEEDMSCFGSQRVRNRNINKRANKDLKFVFDHVFNENSTQVDIFENTTKVVLDGVMNGFNCTVFAYGATGAGKTHTMLGSQDDPGVMYRTMKELFKRMDDAKEEKVFTVAFSYLEVYNEQIRDLLANVGPLAVREDSSKGVVVQGLTLHQPKSAEHILEALDSGNRNRTQHPTDMNATSSRSHAVFQIYLRQQDKTASLNPNVCVAKMSLIDLAGSERASATNAKGARLREGANINRSLLALGNVINALADPKSKKAHIPYRDSKLTRILKDSLGGNCRTVMIANVSPSSKSYDDTHNTLKYANRAKEIKSSLKSNVVSLDSHIGQYAVICEKQRQEILQLKQKLKEYEEKNMVLGNSNINSSQKQAEFKRVSEALQRIFSSRAEIRREQLDLERQLKENELRQRYSEEDNLQIQYFCAKEKTEKATCKHERKTASLRTQQQHICKRLKEAETHFLDNDGWLHRVENEMKLLKSNDQTSEVLEKDLFCHRLQLQVNDLQQHINQMVKLTTLQDQENKRMQKMVNILLPAYSRHYCALRGAGLVTAADEMENHELEHLVLRERGVVWADQEEVGQQLKGEGTGVESQKTNETGNIGLHGELAPVLTFSHLLYHQSSPCSAEGHTKRTSLCKAVSSPKGGRNQTDMKQEPCPRMPFRRNLAASLPPQSPQIVARAQMFEEDVFPLQCTPEPAQKTVQALPLSSTSAMDPNMTFEVLDNDDQTASNATIIISSGSPCQASKSIDFSGYSQPLQPPTANEGNQIPTKRQQIPSLQEVRRANPTYMDMTSAAQGKRKFNRSIREELTQGLSAPKRIKKDPSAAQRPLRVHRFAGSENKPRRVVRSISEGNLNLLEPQKSKSIFYKTSQQFKRVTKRM
ncbi:kinesin-like protein KIF18A isoform X1 [Seriola lalandi dorsalis]|uniref:kinesin-like protein KIF18A isoform X1 n=1 Tax=Seriola lalandi dorsalis TaxID=1841481 RepID=UPI000C6FA213|nr:kinesin-like protein KIF18A isoform X1 [Seriola lalandi dorsalis]XP_056231234.1 kinesin-like protein KIF18A isoform X1 [Seriola aureovittata]